MNVPAPNPPWLRPVQSPVVQFIFGDDAIDLGPDCTYLNQTTAKTNGADVVPYQLTLPDGNYRRQGKRIFVIGATIPNTAEFAVTGTFAGFISLLFNTAATAASLEWDGTAWQLIGGNAQIGSAPPVSI